MLPICVIRLAHLHGSTVYHIELMFVNGILADFIDCSGKMRLCMVSCRKSNWGNTAMTDTQRHTADWQGKGYEKVIARPFGVLISKGLRSRYFEQICLFKNQVWKAV